MMKRPKAKYSFIDARKEWLAVIYRGKTVLSVGCENTEAEIKTWAAQSIVNYPKLVPDMYSRKVLQ